MKERKHAILCIDPGLRGCGLAYFLDGKLVHAQYVMANNSHHDGGSRAWYSMAHAVIRAAPRTDILIVECPQVYMGNKGIDQNDLIELTGVVGCICGTFESLDFKYKPICLTVKPAQWKGQVPKAGMAERIRSKLSKDERTCGIELPSRGDFTVGKNHNVADAIGIGLSYLDRLGTWKGPRP